MKITVDWPDDLTHERLEELARMWDNTYGAGLAVGALHALAAIAPRAPKKRTVQMWMHNSWAGTTRMPIVLLVDELPGAAPGWYKVGGPTEVIE